MEITEVQIDLHQSQSNNRILAFAAVIFDNSFIVREMKVVRGTKGIFVSMPDKKVSDRCPGCNGKNELRAKYCNWCGTRLADFRGKLDEDGRPKLHNDVAHPISASLREAIELRVIAAYMLEAGE